MSQKVTCRTEETATAMEEAHKAAVEQFLLQPYCINRFLEFRMPKGGSYLHLAAASLPDGCMHRLLCTLHHDDRLKLLLLRDSFGCTALQLALNLGRKEIVKMIVEFLTPSDTFKLLKAKSDDGFSVIRQAVNTSHELFTFLLRSVLQQDVYELLLSWGDRKSTALHWVADTGSWEVAKCILGIVTPKDRLNLLLVRGLKGHTALHAAVLRGSIDVMQCIVEAVTPSERKNLLLAKSNDGISVIHVAVKTSAVNVDTLLNGLDDADCQQVLLAKDDEGLTALHWAVRIGDEVTSCILNHIESSSDLLHLLLVKNDAGWTAVQEAVIQNKDTVLSIMLDRLSLEHRFQMLLFKYGNESTIIFQAEQNGNTAVMKSILRSIPENQRFHHLMVRCHQGKTVVQSAADRGRIQMVQCLLESVTSPEERYTLLSTKMADGQTALRTLATKHIEMNYFDAMEIIRPNGKEGDDFFNAENESMMFTSADRLLEDKAASKLAVDVPKSGQLVKFAQGPTPHDWFGTTPVHLAFMFRDSEYFIPMLNELLKVSPQSLLVKNVLGLTPADMAYLTEPAFKFVNKLFKVPQNILSTQFVEKPDHFSVQMRRCSFDRYFIPKYIFGITDCLPIGSAIFISNESTDEPFNSCIKCGSARTQTEQKNVTEQLVALHFKVDSINAKTNAEMIQAVQDFSEQAQGYLIMYFIHLRCRRAFANFRTTLRECLDMNRLHGIPKVCFISLVKCTANARHRTHWRHWGLIPRDCLVASISGSHTDTIHPWSDLLATWAQGGDILDACCIWHRMRTKGQVLELISTLCKPLHLGC